MNFIYSDKVLSFGYYSETKRTNERLNQNTKPNQNFKGKVKK